MVKTVPVVLKSLGISLGATRVRKEFQVPQPGNMLLYHDKRDFVSVIKVTDLTMRGNIIKWIFLKTSDVRCKDGKERRREEQRVSSP